MGPDPRIRRARSSNSRHAHRASPHVLLETAIQRQRLIFAHEPQLLQLLDDRRARDGRPVPFADSDRFGTRGTSHEGRKESQCGSPSGSREVDQRREACTVCLHCEDRLPLIDDQPGSDLPAKRPAVAVRGDQREWRGIPEDVRRVERRNEQGPLERGWRSQGVHQLVAGELRAGESRNEDAAFDVARPFHSVQEPVCLRPTEPRGLQRQRLATQEPAPLKQNLQRSSDRLVASIAVELGNERPATSAPPAAAAGGPGLGARFGASAGARASLVTRPPQESDQSAAAVSEGGQSMAALIRWRKEAPDRARKPITCCSTSPTAGAGGSRSRANRSRSAGRSVIRREADVSPHPSRGPLLVGRARRDRPCGRTRRARREPTPTETEEANTPRADRGHARARPGRRAGRTGDESQVDLTRRSQQGPGASPVSSC